MSTDDKVIAAGAVAMLLFVGVVIWWAGVTLATHRRCLAAGYPASNVTYALEQYCIRRVDQTDVVVPLSVAERAP